MGTHLEEIVRQVIPEIFACPRQGNKISGLLVRPFIMIYVDTHSKFWSDAKDEIQYLAGNFQQWTPLAFFPLRNIGPVCRGRFRDYVAILCGVGGGTDFLSFQILHLQQACMTLS
jgi:hypothetical protein